MLPPVAVRQGLGHALPLVVARAGPEGIRVAAVGFGLRPAFRVAVDFGGAGEEDAGVPEARGFEGVARAEVAGVEDADGGGGEVFGAGGAGEVVDFGGLEVCWEGIGDVRSGVGLFWLV